MEIKQELLIPENDVPNPEFSIVVPAKDEELSIATFLDWCWEGIRRADIKCEILIADSSTDRTPHIALEKGARVLRLPARGLGQAYINTIPHIRGRYIIMGDADCTYDFRELTPFVEKFREGYEYVMGSRVRGNIEKGSMPALNRYFGKPLTNFIMNVMYRTRFSDIHCGMRGVTRNAFIRMKLKSRSWEYASEMIIKAVQLDLKLTEVPIHFLKEKEGRESHMVRAGWLTPWRAGWVNLRAMFLFGVDFFLYKPGILMTLLGLSLVLPLLGGPIKVGPISLSLYWMLLGVSITLVGIQSTFLGIMSRVIYDYNNSRTEPWLRFFSYNRTAVLCGIIFLSGALLTYPLLYDYLSNGFLLPGGVQARYFRSIAGLLMAVAAFTVFIDTLVLHALAIVLEREKA